MRTLSPDACVSLAELKHRKSLDCDHREFLSGNVREILG
jgi:hypothetical protein